MTAGKPSRRATTADSGPVLLAGGNPRIAKSEGDEPVRAYIAAMPGWKRGVGQRLDAIITSALPGVLKAVKWNSPFYGVAAGTGVSWLLSFHTFTKYVKVGFFNGSSLRPMPPGESKSPGTRYLDIREGDRIDEAQVALWVRQAAAIPGWLMEAGPNPTKAPRGRGSARAGARSRIRPSAPRATGRHADAAGDWRRAVLARVRELILEAAPGAIEERKWKKASSPGIPVWSLGGGLCTGETYKEVVKLTFHHGASLADPRGLFNAGLAGSTRRAIDLRRGDALDEAAFKALIRAAVAFNASAGRKMNSRPGRK